MVIVPADTLGTTDWTATPALVCTVACPTLAGAIPPGTETTAVVLPARIFTLPARAAGGHWTDKWNPSEVSVPARSVVWTKTASGLPARPASLIVPGSDEPPKVLSPMVPTNPHAVMSRGKATWYWPVFNKVLVVPGQPARARLPSAFTTAYKARHRDAEVTFFGAWTTGPGGCGLPWLVAAAMPVPASVSTVATPAPSKMWPALDRRMHPPNPNSYARITPALPSHHVTGRCEGRMRPSISAKGAA